MRSFIKFSRCRHFLLKNCDCAQRNVYIDWLCVFFLRAFCTDSVCTAGTGRQLISILHKPYINRNNFADCYKERWNKNHKQKERRRKKYFFSISECNTVCFELLGMPNGFNGFHIKLNARVDQEKCVFFLSFVQMKIVKTLSMQSFFILWRVIHWRLNYSIKIVVFHTKIWSRSINISFTWWKKLFQKKTFPEAKKAIFRSKNTSLPTPYPYPYCISIPFHSDPYSKPHCLQQLTF